MRYGDAREVLGKLPAGLHGAVDLLVVDVFGGARIPAHVTSLEFYQECAALLGPDGVLLVNAADGAGGAFARGQAATLGVAYADVAVLAESAKSAHQQRIVCLRIDRIQHPNQQLVIPSGRHAERLADLFFFRPASQPTRRLEVENRALTLVQGHGERLSASTDIRRAPLHPSAEWVDDGERPLVHTQDEAGPARGIRAPAIVEPGRIDGDPVCTGACGAKCVYVLEDPRASGSGDVGKHARGGHDQRGVARCFGGELREQAVGGGIS